LLAVVAVAGLTAGMAACGGGGGDSKGGASSAAASNKILNVFAGQNNGYIINFNPFSQSSVPGTLSVQYESLLYFNGGKQGDVQPQLATEYAFADGGKTMNFTLRSGVKWSDGQPFSADDVAFTFNLLKNYPKANLNGIPVASATAVDPTHVTITLTEPGYTRLSAVAGRQTIVPKHLWQSVSDPAAYTNEKPVGTGPFKLQSFSAQNIVYERNPNYWESGKPKIGGLRYRAFASPESSTAALAAGQIDWAGSFIPDIDKQFISKDPKHNKYINESLLYLTNLVPNLAKAPTNDVAVRKAISTALDRDQIIKLAFSGYGKYPNQAYLPLPTYKDWIKPEYQQKFPFDPSAAQKILTDAGYVKGSDGIFAKGGQKLSVTCKVVTGYADYISALQIITQEMKAIGIDFKAQEESYTAFATDQQNGSFDFIITNAYASIDAYSWYYNEFATKQTAPIGQVANANYSRYSNPQVDASLEKIAATDPKDEATLKAEILKIQDLVVPQMPYIPLQQSSSLIEYRTTNATNWPTEENHYALAMPFNGPDAGIVAKNLVPVG
jgi:peptide/nickel transport system substrate-binding protein